jgi:hypothetical protein
MQATTESQVKPSAGSMPVLSKVILRARARIDAERASLGTVRAAHAASISEQP